MHACAKKRLDRGRENEQRTMERGGRGLHLEHEEPEGEEGEWERGACSRTCIPQSGIPLLLCRIHIYAASLGDNSAIMRRARARLSRRTIFLYPFFLHLDSFPLFPFPQFLPSRVYIRLDTQINK